MHLDPRVIASHLGRIPMFATLTIEEITDLVRTFRIETVPCATTIFREGDPGGDLVVIESGAVRVHKRTQQGSDELLSELGAWSVLGEMSLLDGQPRSATVTTTAPCTLYRIPREDFNLLRVNLAPAAYKAIRELARTLCARLRQLDARLEDFYADPERSLALMTARQASLVAALEARARPVDAAGARLRAQTAPLGRVSRNRPGSPAAPGRAASQPTEPFAGRAVDATRDLAPFLARVPLLRGLPAADLCVLASVLTARSVGAGVTLFREGDPGDRFFIVARGAVEVLKQLGGGEATQLSRLQPGALFGQVSLIDGQRRSASCRAAADDTLLLECQRVDFDGLFRASSPLAFRFVERLAIDLSWRVRAASERFTGLFSRVGETIQQLRRQVAALRAAVDEDASDIEALLRCAYGR